jgi:NAD(P)-dependent dehydrogenase (short-subunit alcohol dehydrogenase family)
VRIEGSVALVTGANRGLGRAFARALVERGARTVYACARDPRRITDPDVTPITLDITDLHDVATAAERCSDVTLLVNNAGILRASPVLDTPTLDAARAEMETNLFGTLSMCRAFAPVLAANGGGAMINMLSVLSFFSIPQWGSYCVSKAAAWSMTNALRIELRRQGTLVVGVHAGLIDTDMAAGAEGPKTTAEEVARQAVDAVEAGRYEVLADERARQIKAALSKDVETIYGL